MCRNCENVVYCIDGCGRIATTERLIHVEEVPEHTHLHDVSGGDGIVETVELVCQRCADSDYVEDQQ